MGRNLSTSFAIVAMATVAALSMGCGEYTTSEQGPSGVIVKEALEDLPQCSVGKYALVYYVSSTDNFYFCDGWQYIELDLSGLDGIGWLVETAPALPEDCSAGGATVSTGPDADGDGFIDSVISSQTICNGVDGQDGADGEDGTSCTVTSPSDGTVMISCEDGTVATVTDGQDGANGSSCSVADNGDGAKTISCDDGTSVTVSDGQDGADGTPCTVTDNSNGTKTISCEDGTSVTVSDGQDGAEGTSCTITHNGNGTATISCDDGTLVTVEAWCLERRESRCSDGLDNDCDGATDAEDSDCTTEWLCDDGIDNDGDGSVDCADPDCDCCVPPEVDCTGVCTSLDTDPVCSNDITSLGFVSGDTGADVRTLTDHGEAVFRMYVSENEGSLLAHPLSVKIDLIGPLSVDYDLRARCDDCESLVWPSERSGTNERVVLRWDEDTVAGFPSGSDSGRYVYIEVVHYSAQVCADWTLTVTGNTDTDPELTTCSSL